MGKGDYHIREVTAGRVPRWKQYADMVVGKTDLPGFLKYELITFFFGNMPGALGLYLRSKLYPLIFGSVGPDVIFGRGITLRHPHKIRIGRNTVLDDYCVLDAKGCSNAGISIGDRVFIGRNTILFCKDGDIEIKSQANISSNCEVFSSHVVVVGRSTMIAAYCYIMSGGAFEKNSEIAFADQDGYAKGPTTIGEGCWLGAKVLVLDGVSIGDRVIVGAGAVVSKNLPACTVAVGVPAKVVESISSC